MILSPTLSAYRFPFAYVAFGGNPTHWWTNFLKKGFYHCFLIMGNGFEWILIDPVWNYTDLIFIRNKNLLNIIKEKGYKLLRTTPHLTQTEKGHFRPLTCVEVTKRFLGISAPKIWTPYQLFRFILSKKENNP